MWKRVCAWFSFHRERPGEGGRVCAVGTPSVREALLFPGDLGDTEENQG